MLRLNLLVETLLTPESERAIVTWAASQSSARIHLYIYIFFYIYINIYVSCFLFVKSFLKPLEILLVANHFHFDFYMNVKRASPLTKVSRSVGLRENGNIVSQFNRVTGKFLEKNTAPKAMYRIVIAINL